MIVFKRVAIALVVAFVVAVLGLFAFNFYRQYTSGDPAGEPPVIYERSDRPSRA
jgi:predicted negative regulator of RcsB-dependent stress response